MSYRDPTSDPERDINNAGEYVLGTLEGRELTQFLAQLKNDPNLRHEVTQWEERLQPIANAISPVEPPSRVWRGIVNTLFSSQTDRINHASDELQRARRNKSRQLQKHLAAWRAAAGIAFAACIGALSLLWFQHATQPATFDAISVVSNEDGPLWVVDASVDGKVLKITAVAPPQIGSNQVHELWMVKPDSGGVVSLGLLPQDSKTSIIIDRAAIASSAVALAVSLETSGGSSESVPVGPVLYQGEFVLVNATGQ